MTKKDYALVAKCIKRMIEDNKNGEVSQYQYWLRVILGHLVGKLVSEFQIDNPKFNKDKFIKACGLKETK